MRGLPYEVKILIDKARESALLAVETYNRPTANFRSGAYIVLMCIAWTALFHAIFFRKRRKPFYKKPDSRQYVKIEGEPKRWELKECLQQFYTDNNPPERKNLEFFIGLRNKIEHCSLAQLDPEIFGECQSMLLNFESLLTSEFGASYAIHGGLTFMLQFSKDFNRRSSNITEKSQKNAFKPIKAYLDKFRSSLSADIQSALEYSFKVYLVPKIGNRASMDTIAIEWVKYDPTKPDEMRQYEKVISMIKPKEVRVANLGLLKPSQVVEGVKKRLGKNFTMFDHTLCYRHFNARPSKGDPNPVDCDTRHCQYDALHNDYGYHPAWVDFLVGKLSDDAIYKAIIKKKNTNSSAEMSVST